MSLILDLEELIEQLKREPGQEVFAVRRRIEKCRATYLKQGNAIPIVKPLEINCLECGSTMTREDDLYLHLRKSHHYSDEDASSEATNPRHDYESSLQKLEALLTEFTDYYLEEPS
jgi:hypothetical protein